jgi:phosphohistidine phosphatase
MKLYILRHGHSPSVTEARVATDAERPLSERGRLNAAKSAEALLARGARPARILNSPLRRAAETAAIAEARLAPAGGIDVFKPLGNELPADELFEQLRRPLADSGELLVVGHQPQLGELAALLSGQLLDLRPAGLIALDVPEQGAKAKLLWTFHPED